MSDVGPLAAGEDAARLNQRRFRLVAVIALVCAVPFMLGHFAIGAFVVPSLQSMWKDMGGQVPSAVTLLFIIQPVLGPLFLLLDIGIFAGFYFLARRWWIGLLFAPVFAYLAMGMVLIPVLYLPLFNAITVVK